MNPQQNAKVTMIMAEYYPEPRNMLQQKINALTDAYTQTFDKLRAEYVKNLSDLHEVGRMQGMDLIEVEK